MYSSNIGVGLLPSAAALLLGPDCVTAVWSCPVEPGILTPFAGMSVEAEPGTARPCMPPPLIIVCEAVAAWLLLDTVLGGQNADTCPREVLAPVMQGVSAPGCVSTSEWITGPDDCLLTPAAAVGCIAASTPAWGAGLWSHARLWACRKGGCCCCPASPPAAIAAVAFAAASVAPTSLIEGGCGAVIAEDRSRASVNEVCGEKSDGQGIGEGGEGRLAVTVHGIAIELSVVGAHALLKWLTKRPVGVNSEGMDTPALRSMAISSICCCCWVARGTSSVLLCCWEPLFEDCMYRLKGALPTSMSEVASKRPASGARCGKTSCKLGAAIGANAGRCAGPADTPWLECILFKIMLLSPAALA